MPTEAVLPQRRYVTIDEAAAYFGVHRNTVRKWIADGDIRAKRLPGRGRMYRIDLREIEAACHDIDNR